MLLSHTTCLGPNRRGDTGKHATPVGIGHEKNVALSVKARVFCVSRWQAAAARPARGFRPTIQWPVPHTTPQQQRRRGTWDAGQDMTACKIGVTFGAYVCPLRGLAERWALRCLDPVWTLQPGTLPAAPQYCAVARSCFTSTWTRSAAIPHPRKRTVSQRKAEVSASGRRRFTGKKNQQLGFLGRLTRKQD